MSDEKFQTLVEKEQEIIEVFEGYTDWMDRYQYLIELGGELEPLAEEEKNDNTLIRGCQSQVWLVGKEENGRIYFRGEADALIVRGVVALLISVMSGCTVDEVAEADFSFVDKIGLKEHLSPTRSNGLLSMMRQMRTYAKSCKLKNVVK